MHLLCTTVADTLLFITKYKVTTSHILLTIEFKKGISFGLKIEWKIFFSENFKKRNYQF